MRTGRLLSSLIPWVPDSNMDCSNIDWDPLNYDDPNKRQVLERIQMEEVYENKEIDYLDESDPDVEIWRRTLTEDKVLELIAAKVAHNGNLRKYEKLKRYYVDLAGPLDRPRVLRYFGMPPEEPVIVSLIKSAITSVSSIISIFIPQKNVKKEI